MLRIKDKKKYKVEDCKQGRRYFQDGKLAGIVKVASFEDDDETGCPLAGIGKCGNFCTAFYFKIPEE
jgi:hypothetical protein